MIYFRLFSFVVL